MSCCIDVDLRRALLLVLLWTIAPAPALHAEPPAPAPSRPVAIGVGDLLEVRVWREPDLSGEHRVGPDGRLQHVLAGAVVASGRSPAQVAEELRRRLERDYLRAARVSVAVVESASQQASVLGAVARPGAQPIGAETRVLDLLLAAGGLAEAADGRGTLVRARAEGAPAGGGAEPRLALDLQALLAGELAGNYRVRAGDLLLVESGGAAVGSGPRLGAPRVRVVGEVEQPGSYPLRDAGTLLDALLAAGGLGEYAAANRARLVREQDGERMEQRVRLRDVLAGKQGANLELRDGDLLVVPESFF